MGGRGGLLQVELEERLQGLLTKEQLSRAAANEVQQGKTSGAALGPPNKRLKVDHYY